VRRFHCGYMTVTSAAGKLSLIFHPMRRRKPDEGAAALAGRPPPRPGLRGSRDPAERARPCGHHCADGHVSWPTVTSTSSPKTCRPGTADGKAAGIEIPGVHAARRHLGRTPALGFGGDKVPAMDAARARLEPRPHLVGHPRRRPAGIAATGTNGPTVTIPDMTAPRRGSSQIHLGTSMPSGSGHIIRAGSDQKRHGNFVASTR
jgi:hypothetical protein